MLKFIIVLVSERVCSLQFQVSSLVKLLITVSVLGLMSVNLNIRIVRANLIMILMHSKMVLRNRISLVRIIHNLLSI